MRTRYLPSSLQHPNTILISEVEEDLDSHLPAKIRKLEQDEEVCVVGYFESFAVCLSSHTASLPSVRQFKGVIVLVLILRPLALQAMSATGYRLKIVWETGELLGNSIFLYNIVRHRKMFILHYYIHVRSFTMYLHKSLIVMMQIVSVTQCITHKVTPQKYVCHLGKCWMLQPVFAAFSYVAIKATLYNHCSAYRAE